MPTPQPEPNKNSFEPSPEEMEQYAARTRHSLILRLKDWQDRRSWDEFYRTYWRLIFVVSLKSGLRDHEAMDVVQETILTIAKQSRKDMYCPSKGSFKSWLLNITRWRINDQFRLRNKDTANATPVEEIGELEGSELQANKEHDFERLWDEEWHANLVKAAVERVKVNVSPKQFQIFDLNVLRGMDAKEVRKKLNVSIAQVYLAKHRVGHALKKEIEFLRKQGEEFSQ